MSCTAALLLIVPYCDLYYRCYLLRRCVRLFISNLQWNFYRAMLRRARLCHSVSSVCMSVSPSVRDAVTFRFRYRDHIGWNTSKIISRLISLRSLLRLTPTSAIWNNRKNPKIRVEYGWAMSAKTSDISKRVQYTTTVTMTD